MRIARVLLGSVEGGLSRPRQHLQSFRFLSTASFSRNGFDAQPPNSNSSESADEFAQSISGGISGESAKNQHFFKYLDKLGMTRGRFGPSSGGNGDGSRTAMDGLDESFNSLTDGMDGRLKDAATYFEYEEEEEDEYYKETLREGYTYRPDVTFHVGQTYEPKDLDLRRPGIRKPAPPLTFDVTTEEALRKADFRNVRFLANFLTESGIIIKRSSTGISAKAQRKVAREIKTARAFGLLPFTTMGTKEFRFGKTMQDLDHDFQYENYERVSTADAADDVDE